MLNWTLSINPEETRMLNRIIHCTRNDAVITAHCFESTRPYETPTIVLNVNNGAEETVTYLSIEQAIEMRDALELEITEAKRIVSQS